MLRVETRMPPDPTSSDSSDEVLDYRVYDRVPRVWRRLEERLRLDLYLAWRARRIERKYDLIWAGSEKVGIPLTLLRPRRPLIVVAHHPESPLKARVIRALG